MRMRMVAAYEMETEPDAPQGVSIVWKSDPVLCHLLGSGWSLLAQNGWIGLVRNMMARLERHGGHLMVMQA